MKVLIFLFFIFSIIAFALKGQFLSAGIMLGGLSIVIIAEKSEKAREILKRIF